MVRCGVNFTRFVFAAVGAFLALSPDTSLKVAAHTPDEAAGLAQAGDRYRRIRRVLRTEPHRLKAGLQDKAALKVSQAQLEASGATASERSRALFRGPMRAFPFAAKPELKSVGTPKTLTILVDFSDLRAATVLPGLTNDRIRQNIYGDGTQAAQSFKPFESLRAYYHRASEGKLDIGGSVLGWIHLPNKRETYEPIIPPGTSEVDEARIDNQAIFDLVSAALAQVDATTDFAEFDNDNDGDIDLITIMYTGPNTGWGGFWWAYRWEFFVSDAFSKFFDGKRLKQFVFQFVNSRPGGAEGSDFNPTTLIHECGHALGLPDYYDYCSTQNLAAGDCSSTVLDAGPDGGVGGLDIMDGNKGNHNAFSRWLLDWIEPVVVRTGTSRSVTLVPSGSDGTGVKGVAVFPGLMQTSTPGQELFVIENRSRVGNDGGMSGMPAEGLVIWHVDATPRQSNDDFNFDNSFTGRKLIRLIRAHTSKDFSAGEDADARDYYSAGKLFTPASTPNSNGYGGGPTAISITNITQNGNTIIANVAIGGAPPLPGPVASVEGTPEAGAQATMARRFSRSVASSPAPTFDQDKLDQFNTEFQTASPAELAAIWNQNRQQVASSAQLTEGTVLTEVLLMHWAAKDGQAAVEALLQMPRSDFVQQVFPQVTLAWAKNNPAAAYAWYTAAEQAKLRQDDTLSAGEQFASAIFQWRFASESGAAAPAVDLLAKPEDVLGALHGIRDAARTVGADEERVINEQLTKLKVVNDKARALATVQDAVKNASRAFGYTQSQQIEKSVAPLKELEHTR